MGGGPVWYLDLLEVSVRLKRGELSSVDLTGIMLDRITREDSRLHSYATVMADSAMDQARRADGDLRSGNHRGPLHGVPVAVKDLCYTCNAPTASGTSLMRRWVPPFDATVVKRLLDAGAVILGKLEMTEGASGTYHPEVRPPVNPWNPDFWSGFSSSGSGVATAAGLCFGSLGSDTGGSIRLPSSACGLVGLKPTWGRVSRYGVFPLADSFDHVGPMTRSVADAAAMLGVIAGVDVNDPTAVQTPVPDYLATLEDGIQGVRIGVDWEFLESNVHIEVLSALRDAGEALRAQGATLIDLRYPFHDEDIPPFLTWIAAEMAHAHEPYYPQRRESYGPPLAEAIDMGRAATSRDIVLALGHKHMLTGRLARMYQSVDLLLVPVLAQPTPALAEMDAQWLEGNGRYGPVVRYTLPFDASGNPTITLPCRISDNCVPFGFQLVGAHFNEELLFRAGRAFEHATDLHARHPNV